MKQNDCFFCAVGIVGCLPNIVKSTGECDMFIRIFHVFNYHKYLQNQSMHVADQYDEQSNLVLPVNETLF